MNGAWLVMTLAIVAAVGATAWRRVKAHRAAREALQEPGASPDSALEVDLREVDDHILSMTCACGGGFTLRSEGNVEADGRSLRVARLMCARCEAERLLYFNPPPLFH